MSDLDIAATELIDRYIKCQNELTQDIADNFGDRIQLMISRDAYRAVINSMAHLHGFGIAINRDGFMALDVW